MAAQILFERGLRLAAVRDEIARQSGADARHRKDIPHLLEFSRDLTEDANNDRLDPLIGRDDEIERVVQILCRRTKRNPVLIGEPGVGKTAIVEGLAQRIVRGEVPSFLENKRILSLDLSLIVAGTKYRGQFEERLKQIMRELIDNPHYIVFIDELHTLVGAGSAEGSLDAANILKPALSRGEIQCIGATTPAEFRKSIEKDRSLERRFQAVKVPPPTEQEAIKILFGIKDRYEKFHAIAYHEFEKARFYSDEERKERENLHLLREKYNIDETAMGVVTKEDIEEVVSRWTGVPVTAIKEEEMSKLLRIEEELHKRVISQDSALTPLARAI